MKFKKPELIPIREESGLDLGFRLLLLLFVAISFSDFYAFAEVTRIVGPHIVQFELLPGGPAVKSFEYFGLIGVLVWKALVTLALVLIFIVLARKGYKGFAKSLLIFSCLAWLLGSVTSIIILTTTP